MGNHTKEFNMRMMQGLATEAIKKKCIFRLWELRD